MFSVKLLYLFLLFKSIHSLTPSHLQSSLPANPPEISVAHLHSSRGACAHLLFTAGGFFWDCEDQVRSTCMTVMKSTRDHRLSLNDDTRFMGGAH